MENLFSAENFTAYLALAVILYAIRQATNVSNRFIPSIAVVLGVLLAAFEAGGFNYNVLLSGILYALLGIGSVATIKYQLEKSNGGDA
jgi:hypothetical protein